MPPEVQILSLVVKRAGVPGDAGIHMPAIFPWLSFCSPWCPPTWATTHLGSSSLPSARPVCLGTGARGPSPGEPFRCRSSSIAAKGAALIAKLCTPGSTSLRLPTPLQPCSEGHWRMQRPGPRHVQVRSTACGLQNHRPLLKGFIWNNLGSRWQNCF